VLHTRTLLMRYTNLNKPGRLVWSDAIPLW